MHDKSTQSPEPPFNSSPELWEKLKPLAREKRHDSTPAEDFLWQHLRGRQVANAKFRRQHTIGRFIVDFFCIRAKLVIEVDGEIHQYTQEEDAIRQAFIEAHGFSVMRFTNDEVLKHIGTIIEAISAYLKQTESNQKPD